MKTFNLFSFFTSIALIVTSTCASESPRKEWLFVHSSTTAIRMSETTFVMPVWPKTPIKSDESIQTYGYLTSTDFVSLWDGYQNSPFAKGSPHATLSWVEKNRVMDAEIIITSAKVTKNGRAIAYTFNNSEELFAGTDAYANLLIDSSNSGACSISVMSDAVDDGLSETLFAGAGVAYLDCLLEDLFSFILLPAINRRTSPFYGFIFFAIPDLN